MTAPRNIFATKTFYIFTSIVLTAVTPNIAEMVRSGVTVERMLLLAATLSGTGSVLIDRMEKEKNLYAPLPFGRDKSDAIANARSIDSNEAIVKNVVRDAILSPIAAVQERAQSIVENSVQPDPIQEAIDDVVKNPIGAIINPIGTVGNALGKFAGSLFR